MSLHIYDELGQRADEWYDVRRGMVTASVVGRLISVRSLGAQDYTCPACGAESDQPCLSKVKAGTAIKTLHPERHALAENKRDQSPPVLSVADTDEARRLTDTLAAERVTGYTDPTYINVDMWRGVEDEPRAVEKYSETYAPAETCGFMVRDDWGFSIGYSPDGLVGDDGLIEVKSRRQNTQFRTVVNGEVPAANMAQLQCGLLVSGRAWIDYVSYCGGMHVWPKRVYPDQQWFDAILAAVAEFETSAADLISTYNDATTGLALADRPTELELVI